MKYDKKVPKEKYCQDCPSICCENLALEIDGPVNKKEIADLRWQLHFDTVKVYIKSRRWYQWVKGTCRYLTKSKKCSIYEDRPSLCRKHNPPDCELFGTFYDIMFCTPEELDNYFSKKTKRNKSSR